MNPQNLQSSASYANHFLIAMPSMDDPNFARSVTFICQHNQDGAMGIQINRPADLCLGDVFAQLQIDCESESVNRQTVFLGGPVQTERGFVLHDTGAMFESSFRLNESLTVTTSRDVLAALANQTGPKRALVALGYAGWDEGQLEREILENAWLTVPADPEVLFDTPVERRWEVATALLGFRADQLSGLSGRA